jgi:hypothetical protein
MGIQKLSIYFAVVGIVAAMGFSEEPPQRHAVLIGVNDYADPAIEDLDWAEADAKALYNVLTDEKIGKFPKKNVQLLLGEQATAGNIKAALWKLRGVDKNDLVVIFYSGHGAKVGDEAFWITQDAQNKAVPATALSNNEIRKYLGHIPSQRLVTFLDCCFAASTVKKSLLDPTDLFGDFTGKGRVTIAGSADDQQALETSERKAGVFTYYLVGGLKGLADANEDGAVTFEEIWAYLGDNVRKESVKRGGLHEPVIITESGVTPQFLLTFNPSAEAANNKALRALRALFDASKITGAQFDLGRQVLTSPALGPLSTARRKIFTDLAAGRLAPGYLALALKNAENRIRQQLDSGAVGERPTLAVAPFQVIGKVPGKEPGKILAENLLPLFALKYQLIDQTQLQRFCEQDDLTLAGLVEQVKDPATRLPSKAVKLRAVQYLVVGTLAGAPDGTLSVTARICDWQRGTAVGNRFAQIRAENWEQLDARLPLLAGRLLGDLSGTTPQGQGADLLKPPAGDATVAVRVQQVQAIEAELARARQYFTAKSPRVRQLRAALVRLGPPLATHLDGEIAQLKESDKKLAAELTEMHPKRLDLSQKLATLQAYRDSLAFALQVAEQERIAARCVQLLAAAREAEEKGDLRAAYQSAEKARVLAPEDTLVTTRHEYYRKELGRKLLREAREIRDLLAGEVEEDK